MSARTFVNDERTLLVTIYEGQSSIGEVARRPEPAATWGPPERTREEVQASYLPPPLAVVYRNHRGEVATRRIRPISVFFGKAEHHPIAQWLLEVWDEDKGARRTFALADCDFDAADW